VGKWVSTGAYPYHIAEKYMIGYLSLFEKEKTEIRDTEIILQS